MIVKVMSDCSKIGYDPLLLMTQGTVGTQAIEDADLQGAVEISANADFNDVSLPSIKVFHDAVTAKDASLVDSVQWNDNYMYVWAGLELFKAAAIAGNLSPTSTPTEVKQAMYKLDNETLGGLAPPLTYQPGHPTFPACYFVAKITDRQLAPEYGDKAQCIPATQLASFKSALNIPG